MTLEKLLNTLCEKGWEPFGINYYCYFNIRERIEIILWPFWWWEYILEKTPSLRELCSKESQLWQFVCENGMTKKMEKTNRGIWINSWHKDAYESYPVYTMEKYEYRLIESSLKDESELEDFLLSNIKVEW